MIDVKSDAKEVQLNVKIPASLSAKLDKLAEINHRKKKGEVYLALVEWINKN